MSNSQQTAGNQDDGVQIFKLEWLNAEFLGRSKLQLLGLFSPGVIVIEAARQDFLPFWPGVATGILLFLAAAITVGATASDDSIYEYVGRKLRFWSEPKRLTHIRNPEESAMTPARNNTVLGRLGRVDVASLPIVDEIPVVGTLWARYLGGDGAERCQDIVPLERPLQDEYAVVADDGGLIQAIKIDPANMATKEGDEWQRRVDSLANILNSTVEGKSQWYNPARAVDYRSRYNTYLEAEAAFRRDAASADPQLPHSDVLADVCRERAGVVHRHQETSFVRDHYWLVRIDPEESVLEELNTSNGGLHTVWGLGDLLTRRELKKQAGSEEQIEQMLDTLDKRVEDMAEELRGIKGIGATPISSTELSRVAADNFRAVNMFAYGDFSAFVRQSPSPSRSTGDPEHEADYQHISKQMPGSDYGPSVHATPEGTEPESENYEGRTPGAFDAERVNEGIEVGLVESREELIEHYKSALAPFNYERSAEDEVVLDEELHCGTLSVNDYPGRPSNGLLETVLSYTEPGVSVTVSTHMEKDDRGRIERLLSDAIEVLEDKAENAFSTWYIPNIIGKKYAAKAAKADSMLDSLVQTTHDVFEASTYITVRAPSKDLLDKSRGKIERRLKDQRATVKPLTENEHIGFLSSAPVVMDKAKQSVKMRADGLASMFSWSSKNLYEPGGISLGLHRDRNEPTVFNPWDRGTGYSIGIFGKVGSGKTTTLSRILLRLKLLTGYMDLLNPLSGNTLLVMMDPLEEFAGMCKLFGGERIVIGSDTNLNIMAYEEHSGEHAEEKQAELGDDAAQIDAKRRALNHIRNYYSMRGLSGFGDKRAVWDKAMSEAYDAHGPEATLQHTFDVMRRISNETGDYVDSGLKGEAREESVKDLRAAATAILTYDIEEFRGGGEFHNLTQPSEIDFTENNVYYLDLRRYESETDTGPGGFYMEILTDRVYDEAKRRKRNGGRTIFSQDEAHYILGNDSNLESTKQMMLHHRHYDIMFIFSTQQLSEFFKSGELKEAAKAIFDNFSTRIYHFTDELDESWLGSDGIDLNHREFEFIQTAKTGEENDVAEALVVVDKEGSFPIRVDYSDQINPREFSVVQFDPTDHGEDLSAYLREYRSDDGVDVCQWDADLSPSANPESTDAGARRAAADGGETQ